MNLNRWKILCWFCLVSAGVLGGAPYGFSDDNQTILTIENFLTEAAQNDTEFERILIDELTLQYQKALRLPAKDIILSVKQQHEFFYDQDRDSPDTTVSLSKLFPWTGTEWEVAYQAGASLASDETSSEISFSLSQPIAENAFGRSTRWLDKIVGLEIDVARHQIVEAYEDYLAFVLTAYYSWCEAYENLKVGQSSYQANLKLLENMHERQKQKIAHPIDVNKVKLQVMSKEERLIELEERYQNSLHIIKRIIRYEGEDELVPIEPDAMDQSQDTEQKSFEVFYQESRTFDILRLLEKKSDVQVARDADALLPSINILLGYEVSGAQYDLQDENNFFFAGLEVNWPIGDQVNQAEYEVSQIASRQAQLNTTNTYYRLYTQLHNLYLQIEREQKLRAIARKRIGLAESILEAETENYSFGKVTLNDYIQAVNDLDTNRFNQISHEALYRKLLVEWLRLRDQLVQYKDIRLPLTEK